MRILALQSGTSADGIDAALVDVEAGADGLDLVLERWGTEPWLPDERALVMRAVEGERLGPQEWCRLETAVGQAFARAAVSSTVGLPRPDLVCAHGQTVFHGVADGAVWGTLQVGEPAWIARATGCPVLFNVRVADVAAGGMGAPLISAFDARWLRGAAQQAGAPIASLNLGGIANLQVVRPDGTVTGFDTGPANALLDAYLTRETSGAETFDRDGHHAAAGRVDAGLLQRLLAHPYFALDAPKTTGRETFTLATVDAALADVHEQRTPTAGDGVSSAGARAPSAQRPGAQVPVVERVVDEHGVSSAGARAPFAQRPGVEVPVVERVVDEHGVSSAGARAPSAQRPGVEVPVVERAVDEHGVSSAGARAPFAQRPGAQVPVDEHGVSSAGAGAPFAQRPGVEVPVVERARNERDETPRTHEQPRPYVSARSTTGVPALDDVCATLAELTAASVADALHRAAPDAAHLVVSGGGARNPVLLDRLAALAGVPVEPSDAWGIPADARESVMFAALAYLSALRVPLQLPGTPEGRAAVAGQWDLSVAPLPTPPAVREAALQRLRVRTREERP